VGTTELGWSAHLSGRTCGMITEGAGPSAVHAYRLCGPNAHDGMNGAKLVYVLMSECNKCGAV
jgi:hypothetical protein